MELDFNRAWTWWKYGGENKKFTVNLPHDAMIIEPRVKCFNEGNTGFFPGGRYIYQKKFNVENEWIGKQIVIFFEGIYRHATVYVNEKRLAYQAYGYTEFEVDITDTVKNGENIVTVDVDNTLEPNSRWYSGSGIYRPVSLIVRNHDYIKNIKIVTKSINPAIVSINCDKEANVEIYDGENLVVSGKTGDITIPDARLWSDETPSLYKAVLKTENDQTEVHFGIRTLSFSGRTGVLINGKENKFRGACIHHDNGVLGACEFEDAAYRKIAILKKAGYNAIRSSHNPCSRAILRACDELGMYVMDESFDMWYVPKSYHDYSRDFYNNYKKDIKAMILKCVNHPSVIMYSIGNENSEPGTEKGMALAREQAEFIRSLDNTRIITIGINLILTIINTYKEGKETYERKPLENANRSFIAKLGNLGSTEFNFIMSLLPGIMKRASKLKKSGKIADELMKFLDIVGLNYGTSRYEMDLKRDTDKIYMGSETFVHQIAENWGLVKKYKNLVGDFVWTGWDYIGEAGSCGAWDYPEWGKYPLLDGVGTCDITGFITPQAVYMQIAYGLYKKPYIAVRPVHLEGRKYIKGSWRMTNAVRSWSWHGCEGKKASVEVYADAVKAELFINGRSCGVKKLKNMRTEYKLKYERGELSVKTYDAQGKVIGEDKLVSADNTRRLLLTPEKKILKANGQDLCFLNIEITDTHGNIQPAQDISVSIEINGDTVTLAGLGSARTRTDEVFDKPYHLTHFGRALAVLRAGYKPGKATVTVSSSSMDPERVEIEVV